MKNKLISSTVKFGPISGVYSKSTIGYSQAIDTTASAIFGQLSYSISDRVSMTAGLRYTNEDEDFRALSSVVGPLLAGPFNPLLDDDIDCTGTKSFSNVSRTYGVTFSYFIGKNN